VRLHPVFHVLVVDQRSVVVAGEFTSSKDKPTSSSSNKASSKTFLLPELPVVDQAYHGDPARAADVVEAEANRCRHLDYPSRVVRIVLAEVEEQGP
jgi:hypothetical protein